MVLTKFFKSKKLLILTAGVVIVAGITGLIFYLQKLPVYKLSIKPTELSPFVSHQQARATICQTMKGQLFNEVCEKKFESVGKSDTVKIGALLTLLKTIENDRGISDYYRLLLAQAVFASLPTKDSPLARSPEFSATLAKHNNSTIRKNIAYAKESNNNSGMGEEEFKKMMADDLAKIVGNLPKGDNAWVINVAVSTYGWVNGVRQPIYSKEYVASYNPYPGVSTEDKAEREQYDMTHVQSRVGSFATNQEMYNGLLTEGSGEMIGYSFSMASFYSKPYSSDSVLTLAEAGPSEYDYNNTHDFTEKNYEGGDLLADLLANIKMPARQQPKQDSPKTESSEEMTQSSWGSPYEWETAYEAYFWMHLQDPSRFPSLFVLLAQDEEASGKFLRDLPLGTSVDLKEYFSSKEVREFYEFTRQNTTTAAIPSLDDFLAGIDESQADLDSPPKPSR